MPPKRGASKKKGSGKTPTKKTKGDALKENASSGEAIISPSASPSTGKKASKPNHIAVTRRDGESLLSFYSRKYWSDEGEKAPFDNNIIKEIFDSEFCSENQFSSVPDLEQTSYLENYLWENISHDISFEHIFSVVLLVNEKVRQGLSIFSFLTTDGSKFELFFEKVITLLPPGQFVLSMSQQASVVVFLTSLFLSLDNGVVRQCALRYLSLPIWKSLSSQRLNLELEAHPKIRRIWSQNIENNLTKQDHDDDDEEEGEKKIVDNSTTNKRRRCVSKRTTPKKKSKPDCNSSPDKSDGDSTWIPNLIQYFLTVVEGEEVAENNSSNSSMHFVARFCELLIDLLSQLPTRRFLNTLLDDMNVIIRCKMSRVYLSSGNESLFRQLVDRLDSYSNFEIDDQTGTPLTPQDTLAIYNDRLLKVQQVAHKHFPGSLRDVYFSSTGALAGKKLRTNLSLLSADEIMLFGKELKFVSTASRPVDKSMTEAEFLLEVIMYKLSRRQSQGDSMNQTPLIPNEDTLWNSSMIPSVSNYDGRNVLSLPKLNLQFLTVHDHLLRNFILYGLESAYEIRQDIQDAVRRMSPRKSLSGGVSFDGWARMALPIQSISIDEVLKPLLGEVVPSRVTSSVEIDLSRFQGDIREEWEALREHDVIFLISIRDPKLEPGQSGPEGNLPVGDDCEFPSVFGIQYVRGGEIFEVRDEEDVVLNDYTRPDERSSGRAGSKRRLRINLDNAQYYKDVADGVGSYEQVNLLVRRKSKENNFKAVLETIRELMNSATTGRVVPQWLHDVFLGYGDPTAAHYKSLSANACSDETDFYTEVLDYTDTFLDASHVVESFPTQDVSFQITPGGDEIKLENIERDKVPQPPYQIKIEKHKVDSKSNEEKVVVIPYKQPPVFPFSQNSKPSNTVRYTPAQVEALRSGMNRGLTMVVGPPGTGKTDVTVQIICNLYHNFPTQKILLVAHSNAALNDVFEKIMQRDVDPRHLLRLGSGEKNLFGRNEGDAENDDVFSKQGRVNWSLSRRLQLLNEVQQLASSLGVSGDIGSSCETAEYFYLEHVQPLIEKFEVELKGGSVDIKGTFPFHSFFDSNTKSLFDNSNCDQEETAMGCVRYVNRLFEELSDYRAFELLRTQNHRADYLVTKQARIVAMTCTHAAINRKRLVQLNYKFDSLIMEEAAQMLEVETVIPMLLQDNDITDKCRLKRVVLLGDHNQLPPVVQHPAFQKFSHLDQSLFARLIRLSVPNVVLDRQGRSRPQISALFSWRYKGLGNLPHVSQGEYLLANAGFAHTYQLIDVPPFQDKGETCPTPHFFQNLGEAEYVVAVYQFMRLIGYPADRISIITTYNGQKSLIQDIVNQRCRSAMFGKPACVTTVDKFQGRQNDIILLSLVRTESVGHLRDIRRLVVAASRARFGLYVFCRKSLFAKCPDLAPTFSVLLRNPTKLQLVDGEQYPCTRKVNDPIRNAVIDVDDVTAMGVIVYQMTQNSVKGNTIKE